MDDGPQVVDLIGGAFDGLQLHLPRPFEEVTVYEKDIDFSTGGVRVTEHIYRYIGHYAYLFSEKRTIAHEN